ncbi:MAG TPA: dihydrolipoamide acetyltransferase family protein [Rhodocyclaceae bacterium]|nr:dihydrolipoamide acetyltransferase family protein [Rhodocyclaceae bacterium]HRQ47292.1 dihydrolipoamide acetyltransferase family protein [Rhodocyclaceae bacterium]
MTEFLMPSLGADMEEGTFLEWLVKPGEKVSRGQVVCVVETQKGAVDVEIWESGIVDSLVAAPGQVIPVGGVMALIRGESETAKGGGEVHKAIPKRADKGKAKKGDEAPRRRAGSKAEGRGRAATAEGAPTPDVGRRIRISPAARKRALELGVDLAEVTATGPGGVVCLADVERTGAPMTRSDTGAVAKSRTRSTESAADAESRRLAMREAIATAMARSNREIPHYYLGTSINVEPALKWLEKHNAGLPVAERLLFALMQLRAVAMALRDVPTLNGWMIDDAFRQTEAVHLGVAISLRGGGLVAPALRDADTLGSAQMMAALRDLLQRARTGQLRSSELTDTGITITNLGDLGVESVYGVIYPPQVALVGFGRVMDRPWVDDGKVVAARCVHTTLAADHRVTDGAVGARFLGRLTDLLQEPESLWEE